jgi:hypothetical protein
MPTRISMVLDNPQANLNRQKALYNYTIMQQQKNKISTLRNGNGFHQSMIHRLNTATKSCSACGH